MTTVITADVIIEAALLKTFAIKTNYDSYLHLVDSKRLQPTTNIMLEAYKKYYSQFANHEQIDFGLFYTQFAQNWHIDLPAEQIEYYREHVLPAVLNSEIENVESCILGLLKKKTFDDVAKCTDIEKLKTLIEEFETKANSLSHDIDEDVTKIDNVDFEELDKANGIPYFLPALQSGLGSLVKGQFVVVSADYGTGKSAFVISQTVSTLKHLKEKGDTRPILYFNSEGTSADIFGRVCSNLYKDKILGGFEEVVAKAPQVKEHFIKTFTSEALLVLQMASANIDWIHSKIKKYNPALVIIDITDTLAKEEDVMHLKKVYDQLRLLSGKYCPIIGTSQSGDTSYQDKETNEIKTRKWLGDKALYGSKTGKGGAADTIIAIGRDDVNKQLRYISTPKKKRGSPVNVTCELVDKYSLYKEMAW